MKLSFEKISDIQSSIKSSEFKIEIKGSTDGLEQEGEKLARQEAERERIAAERIRATNELKNAFVSLGEEIGISKSETELLFEGIENGFDSAGEAAQAFGSLAQGVFSELARSSAVNSQNKIAELEREREAALSNSRLEVEDRERIEQAFQDKINKVRNEQLKKEKEAAIFNSLINTAVAVVKALPNIPLSIAVGALGAIQTGIIASRPIPEFKDGVLNFEGGYAIIGDGGKQEPVTDKKGNLKYLSPKVPTLTKLDKGDNVFPSIDDYMVSMSYENILRNSAAMSMAAQQERLEQAALSQTNIVNVQIEKQIEKAMTRALKNSPPPISNFKGATAREIANELYKTQRANRA